MRGGLSRCLAAGAVGATLAAGLAPRPAQAGEARVRFDIPGQPLAAALNAFAVQSGRQILYAPSLTAGRRSAGLKGAYAPDEALRQLLSGAGLAFATSGDSFLVREAPQPRPAPPEPATAAGAAAQIDEVVVTATKRATLAQSTPIAMTVLSGEMLTRLGKVDLTGAAPLLPGLKTVSSSFGRRLILRGVYGAGEPTTGLYYDETPVTGPVGTTADPGEMVPELLLVDVDRIELLRGPQGTLYGSGSMGGTLRILFNRPVLDSRSLGARLEVGAAQHGALQRTESVVVNAPLLNGAAAVRVAAYDQSRGGVIDNLVLGAQNIDGSRIRGLRAGVLWEPDDRLSLQLSGAWQETHLDDVSAWNGSAGPWRAVHAARAPFDGRVGLASAVLRKRTDWGALTVASSVFDWKLTRRTNYAGTLLLERTSADGCRRYFALGAAACSPDRLAAFGAYVDSLYPAVISQPVDLISWINEIRLASRDDSAFRWTLGAFSERRHDRIDSQVLQADPATGLAYQPPRFIGRRGLDNQLRQTALFGEASYDPAPGTTLTAGARWFRYRKRDTGGVSIPNVVSGTYPDYALDASSADDGWSLKFLASHELRPGALVYAQASQGFRPGGVNGIPGLPAELTVYRSDRLWNYEAGLKSDWLAKRLQANLAVYWIDWRDMQYSVQTKNRAFSFLTNIGASRIQGAEAEFAARPARGWQAELSLTYTDARLTADQVTNTAIGVGVKGDRLPVVPRFTAAGSLERTWPIGGAGLHGRARLDGSYAGEAYSGFNAGGDYFKMGGFALFDLRLGIGAARWEAQLAVENLLDRAGAVQTGRYALGDTEVYGASPRTVRASLALRF